MDDRWDELHAERDEIMAQIAHLRRRVGEIDDEMSAIERREVLRDYQEGLI